MSFSFICSGCGQPIAVADDYRRNKIQCPVCGVIVPIPEDRPAPRETPVVPTPRRARQEPVAKPRTEITARPEPVAQPRDEIPQPEPEPVIEEHQPPVYVATPTPTDPRVPCRRCGRPVRRQRECPSCDAFPEEEPATATLGEAGSIPTLEIPTEEDETTPYLLEGGELRLCPECKKEMEPESVVCLACGFHQRRRKKLARKYEPLVRRWETDYRLENRLMAFFVLQGISLTVSAGFLLGGAELSAIVPPWLVLTLLSSFLFGTYARLDLLREPSGRVHLSKTWRICFVQQATQPIPLHGYEGLVSGRASEAGSWEHAVFFLLMPTVIPAFLWWYYAINKVVYHVALARDHGYPAVYLFQGWSEAQRDDIALTLSDVAGLRYTPGC